MSIEKSMQSTRTAHSDTLGVITESPADEVRFTVRSVGLLWVDGFAALRRPTAITAVLALVWTVAILGDAVTTIAMMSQGYEEANSYASAGMGVIGSEMYVLLATVVAFLLVLPSFAKHPFSTFSRGAIWAVSLVFGLLKLAVAMENLALWLGYDPLFPWPWI